jgi:CubicO group peptidase (beta-lactamase class C family)
MAAPRLSRRAALAAGGGGLAAALLAAVGGPPASALAQGTPAAATPGAPPAGRAVPVTGHAVPALAAFDRAVAELMAAWGVPGAQLAVAKDGRLVLDRGYGFGDVEAGEPVQPGSRFRIASVSKALTAVAVLTLVDAGKLALEDRAFPLLALEPPANATVDPRLAAVTVGDLLVHAGGWDSAASGDPQSLPWSRTAAATVGAPDPPDGPAIVRFMLGWGLDFDPGAKSVYSNFGFNVLGRVIEQVAGEGYED